MHDEGDKTEAWPTAGGSPPRATPEAGAGLARPLQEHLAQKLRSAYHELAEKPTFLGDPAVPAEFEYHLQRLEAVEKVRHTEKVHNQGVEAVKAALESIAGPLDSEPSAPAEGLEPGKT